MESTSVTGTGRHPSFRMSYDGFWRDSNRGRNREERDESRVARRSSGREEDTGPRNVHGTETVHSEDTECESEEGPDTRLRWERLEGYNSLRDLRKKMK